MKWLSLISLVYLSLISTDTVVIAATSGTNPNELPDTSNDPQLAKMIADLKEINATFNDAPPKSSRITFPVNLKIGLEESAKRFSKFAGAAYCSDANLIQWSCSHCKALGGMIAMDSVITHGATDTKGFVAIDHNAKSIILSFRGSYNIKNWIQNIKLLLVSYGTNTGANLKVHEGFKQATDGLSASYIPKLKPLLAYYTDYKLVVIGHSLGGAIATLAALDAQTKLKIPWDRIQLFTYGEPRVGNPEFAAYVASLPFTLTRIVNNKDVVPHVPPRLAGYNHHHNELWLTNSAKVCSTTQIEDPSCSLSVEPFLSVANHLWAWDTFLGGFC